MVNQKIIVLGTSLVAFSIAFVSGIVTGKQLQKRSEKKKSDLLNETEQLKKGEVQSKNGLVED